MLCMVRWGLHRLATAAFSNSAEGQTEASQLLAKLLCKAHHVSAEEPTFSY